MLLLSTVYWQHLILNQKHTSHEPHFYFTYTYLFSKKFLNVFLSYNHLYFNSATRQTCIEKFFFFFSFFRFLVQVAEKVQLKMLKGKSLERRNISREIWEGRQSALSLKENNWCLFMSKKLSQSWNNISHTVITRRHILVCKYSSTQE